MSITPSSPALAPLSLSQANSPLRSASLSHHESPQGIQTRENAFSPNSPERVQIAAAAALFPSKRVFSKTFEPDPTLESVKRHRVDLAPLVPESEIDASAAIDQELDVLEETPQDKLSHIDLAPPTQEVEKAAATRRERIEDVRDRFIPRRAYLSQPAAAMFSYPCQEAAKTHQEFDYQRALSQALFDSERIPHLDPILRETPAGPSFYQGPPSIPSAEVYSASPLKTLDAPGFYNDFYSMPTAYSPESDKMAIILKDQGPLDASGRWTEGTQVLIQQMQTERVDPLFPTNALYPNDAFPLSVAFNQKGNFLILGLSNGSVEAWSLKTDPPKRIQQFNPAASRGKPVARINSVVVHDHKIYAADHNGRLFIIDPKNESIVSSRHHKLAICNIVVSPNGRFLATGGTDNQVIIRDTRTMKPIHSFQMNAPIKAMAFDPNGGPRIAVGGGKKDPRICVYNFLHPEQQEMIEIPMGIQTTNILWPKRSRLITTHMDGTYRVIPIRLDGKHRVGKIVSIPTMKGRILFSGIRDDGKKRSLICVGANQGGEIVVFMPLPREPKPKPKPAESIFDTPPLTR